MAALRDMKAKNVTSILMEVRFPESYPLGPPFFRVVYPRFLQFNSGGGGNITAGKFFVSLIRVRVSTAEIYHCALTGGSICMDLCE
jgi:hypothetical protein